jgi:hypothetical protein
MIDLVESAPNQPQSRKGLTKLKAEEWNWTGKHAELSKIERFNLQRSKFPKPQQ